MSTTTRRPEGVPRLLLMLCAVLAAVALAACGGDEESEGGGGDASSAATQPAQELGLENPERLTVGMNLQFEPQMYLENGEPAGYDVELLEKLAQDMGVQLDIQNLDFNGLIPGLQAGTFDMVSVGLSPTPERDRAIDFSRGYVPYVQVMATKEADADIADRSAFDEAGRTITALQGSTGEQLAKELFPKAEVKGFPDQNAAFLEVATGRADAIVVEDYLLAQFQESNPGQLEKADIEPLDVQYGSYGIQEGNAELKRYLDRWLCEAQQDGTLEQTYKRVFEVEEFPAMQPC